MHVYCILRNAGHRTLSSKKVTSCPFPVSPCPTSPLEAITVFCRLSYNWNRAVFALPYKAVSLSFICLRFIHIVLLFICRVTAHHMNVPQFVYLFSLLPEFLFLMNVSAYLDVSILSIANVKTTDLGNHFLLLVFIP